MMIAPLPPRSSTSTPPLHDHLCRHKSAVMLLVTVLMLLLFTTCLSHNVVEYLPGFQGTLPFKLHTGYIGVGENEEVQLFYYFVESEGNPEEVPLVVWFTGGPGCSSMYGLIFEVGPLSIDYANSYGRILPSLTVNEYAWTKVANIIFLDQPVGTGFSYSETGRGYYCNDTTSATHIYEFLRKWLMNNPKYLKNPLYLSGSSYAGITLPLVVEKVYDGIKFGSEPLMNMKGYSLENPLTDRDVDFSERISYAHRMGFLSERLYQSVKELCHEEYVLVDMANVLCVKVLQKVYECIDKIRWLHILEPNCDDVSNKYGQFVSDHVIPYKNAPTNFLQSVAATRKSWCREDNHDLAIVWANHKSVQKALHVREGKKTDWILCNTTIQHAKAHQEITPAYVKTVISTVDIHKKFTNKSCRALIYCGDHDLYVPHIATKKWIDVYLNVSIQSDWRPWFVDDQIAGYSVTYGESAYELTYATVKGAGHTPPEYKPAESLAMIRRWFDRSAL